jgi:tetratricopeptide (TPR) repeat protein
MNTKFQNIVKYGIPAVVMFAVIYAVFFVGGRGDPEFGAIGPGEGILLLLTVILFLYFITGIIVWASKNSNYLFLSALYSIIIGAIIIIISIIVDAHMAEKRSKAQNIIYQKRNEYYTNKIDSLSSLIRQDPNNGNLIAQRALVKKEWHGNAVSKELIKEFELAAEKKSSDIEVYRTIKSHHYRHKSLIIKYYKNALINDSLGQISFSDAEKKEISETLKTYVVAEQEIIKECNDKIQKNNKDVELLSQRAGAYYKLGLFDKALADIDLALKIKPDNEKALSIKADIFSETGKEEQAIALYEKLIQKNTQMCYRYRERLNYTKGK